MQCIYPDCEKPATFHVSRIQNRRCVEQRHWCEPHARELLYPYVGELLPFTGRRSKLEHARQFEFSSVVITEAYDEQAIYLHEVDGERAFPVIVGLCEAAALDRKLNEYPSPRPLTYDAWANSIRLLGGELKDVVVHHLENRTWHADARIARDGRLIGVGIRPSDAFVLAVSFDCPVFFTDAALDESDRQGRFEK